MMGSNHKPIPDDIPVLCFIASNPQEEEAVVLYMIYYDLPSEREGVEFPTVKALAASTGSRNDVRPTTTQEALQKQAKDSNSR